MNITISWDKKVACYRVKTEGCNRGFDQIVAVDAFVDGILFMTPKPVKVKIVDRTPTKSFQWRIDQLREAGKVV